MASNRLDINGGLFDQLAEYDHEQLSMSYAPTTGYKGIIAIHNTTLGPALGGTRFWQYDSEADAVRDVLRLARGMTYKAAVAGLNLGGGKSVIIGDNRTTNREGLFRSHGRHVESLAGRYITAEDVGTSPPDMDFIKMETEHVVGLQGRSGDPSPVTAYGVYRGIKACAKQRWGSDDLTGKRVAVEGVGHVGYWLCKDLAEEGAEVFVTDIDPVKIKLAVEEFGAKAVATTELFDQDTDIYAPCALGATINDETLPKFRFEIIAGAANNQLDDADRHGEMLEDRGILYAPDYVINAGGLINVNTELEGWSAERAKHNAAGIYDTLLQVFEIAKHERIPTCKAADRLAEKRIEGVAQVTRSLV